MQLHILENNDSLCNGLIAWMEQIIKEVLKENDKFTIALSGGSTPKLLYQKLALNKNIDWSKIHFFWGDERTVPFSDERNNAHMAFNELLNKIPVPENQIHVMRTDIPLDESVRQYDELLHEYFKGGEAFDLVLLGMGADGHTLSLFPDGKLINDNISWVASGKKTGEDISRITLMPAIVNKSKYIVFLVSGKDKSEMLKNVLELDPYYPANLIDPISKQLHFFLDKDASALLSNH